MQIVKARIGQENESRHFCEVEVAGAPVPVVCRGATKAAAVEKARAYCQEHYGLELTSGHFAATETVPAEPEATDVDDVPPTVGGADAVTPASDAAPTPAPGAPKATKKAKKDKPTGEQDAD